MNINEIQNKAFSNLNYVYKKMENSHRCSLSDYETFYLLSSELDFDLAYKVYKTTESSIDNMPDNYTIVINDLSKFPGYFSFCRIKGSLTYQAYIDDAASIMESIREDFIKKENLSAEDAMQKTLDFLAMYLNTINLGLSLKLRQKDIYIATKNKPLNHRNPQTKSAPFRFISTKKHITKYKEVTSEPLEWEHSWKVIGHWRNIKGVGKDRDGSYIVNGRTWINPCIKGAGQLTEKIRVLK